MRTTIHYVFLTAVRDRLFVGLFAGMIAVAMLSLFLGGTSLVENAQASAVFAAAASRVLLVIGLVVFVCFHLRQAFDAKEIDLLLSRPVSRSGVVLAYWLGFALIAFLLTLSASAVVAVLGIANMEGYGVWGISLLLELLVMVSLALFTGFMLKSAVSSVLTCLGFYVLARMAGLFVMTSESGLLFRDEAVNHLLEYTMKGVSVLMPRLDLFSQSEWLVYGTDQEGVLMLCLIQAAIYVPLLLLATVVDFKRKEF